MGLWILPHCYEKADSDYAANLYKEAILAYEKALASDAEQPTAMIRLAEAYQLTNNLVKAEEWYAKAIKYSSTQKYIFEYAQMLKSNGKIAEARKWFLEYAKFDAAKGQHFANSCNFVEKQAFAKSLFEVKSMPELNTKNADFAPIISNNLLIFASSRSVAVQKDGAVTWTNDAFNQHYIAEFDLKTDSLLSLKPFRHYIGRDINDAPMSYTKKGDWVAITSNNYMDGIRHIEGSGLMMDIYLYQTKSLKEWDHNTEKFFPYNAGVDASKPYSTGHPCLSADGSALYFCSNVPGGYGGYDLYVSYRLQSGWSKPRNLGPTINTPGNEMSPFVDEFGRLYFASDWHEGFGGLDIFSAERMDNGIDWGFVINLGSPVNSPYDDMYFSFDTRNRYGYFSSNRPGGRGNEDIYKVAQVRTYAPRSTTSLKAGDKVVLFDPNVNQSRLTAVSSELSAMVEALKNTSNLVVQVYAHTDSRGSASSNAEISQKYAFAAFSYLNNAGIPEKRIRYQGFGEQHLLNGCKDGVTCSEEEHQKNKRIEFIIIGHLDDNGKFIQDFDAGLGKVEPEKIDYNTNQNNPNGSNPEEVKIKLPTTTKNPPLVNNVSKNSSKTPERKSHYAIGDVIEVAAVNYEHNKYAVDPNSPGLKELLDILNEQQHVLIEIGAHTDAQGADAYNLDLSQKRADALKKYLIAKGIDAKRLIAKGYGESKILNRCKNGVACSAAEHAVNRRTEFKVIGQAGFKIGDVIQVSEISYAFGSETLDMKRSEGLNEIIKVLKENEISVEIRSHTDARGTSENNLELSEKRAKAVYDYLVKSGVNKFRLKYKGYGETMLLNKCKDGVYCTEEQHAANRRTDFKVIGLK